MMRSLLRYHGRTGRAQYFFVTLCLLATVIIFALVLDYFFPGTWAAESVEDLAPDPVRDVFLYALLAYYALVAAPLQFLVAIRRLHDFNRSGYWVFARLVPIVGLLLEPVLLLMPGSVSENTYGKKPERFIRVAMRG